jgi:predicted metal-dependent hydrolase
VTDTLRVDDLTFEILRSSRRKTVEIAIERDGRLIVRAPQGAGRDIIEQIARARRGWVYKKLGRKEKLTGSPPLREYVAGEGFPYLGRSYRLALMVEQAVPLEFRDGWFRLLRSEAGNGRIHFMRWYTAQGKPWLEERLAGWAPRMGAEGIEISIRDLGFRWGSCGNGRINFHWATITLPPSVIDYVVVHELAHLAHPDHGSAFWAAVERALPNAADLRDWLAIHGSAHTAW